MSTFPPDKIIRDDDDEDYVESEENDDDDDVEDVEPDDNEEDIEESIATFECDGQNTLSRSSILAPKYEPPLPLVSK